MIPRDINDYRRYHFAVDAMILKDGEAIRRDVKKHD